MIKASIEKLGFKFRNTKILLISHAHWDHDAASAMIKDMTGATYMVMHADVPVVESGGKSDFHYGKTPASLYRPTKVDHVLYDGEEVKLGGTALVADSSRINISFSGFTCSFTRCGQEGLPACCR